MPSRATGGNAKKMTARKTFTHVAYSDEAYYSKGEYRSIYY